MTATESSDSGANLYDDKQASAASGIPLPSLRVLQAMKVVRSQKIGKAHGGYRRAWSEREILKARVAASMNEHFALNFRIVSEAMIGAVEKETALVLVLFAFMSIVAVFLVLAIFWSMVSEKTKDIGILRALGASRMGVAWVWVRYGLAIGVVGALLGGAMAYLIVLNINPIHDWMGKTLGMVIWDPKIYYFSVIPNKVNGTHAVIVMVCFVLSCAVGAFIPAMRAAWLHPVKALRFE